MNIKEWEDACRLTEDAIEKLKTHTATWKPHLDDDSCTNTLQGLKIIDISPGNQTIQHYFSTQGLSKWESDKGQPYKYNCVAGYNQEDSSWDDVTKTFFDRLIWKKK